MEYLCLYHAIEYYKIIYFQLISNKKFKYKNKVKRSELKSYRFRNLTITRKKKLELMYESYFHAVSSMENNNLFTLKISSEAKAQRTRNAITAISQRDCCDFAKRLRLDGHFQGQGVPTYIRYDLVKVAWSRCMRVHSFIITGKI